MAGAKEKKTFQEEVREKKNEQQFNYRKREMRESEIVSQVIKCQCQGGCQSTINFSDMCSTRREYQCNKFSIANIC